MGLASKGKVCLIDGASLENMARRSGVQYISARSLFILLRYQVGHTRCFCQPPTITLQPHVADNEHGVAGAWRRYGFEVVGAERYNEADDAYIEKKICGIKCGQAEEIVIVSSDHRFIDPLRTKCQSGTRVVWVAADVQDGKGISMIGNELRACIRRKEFDFFDLRPKMGALEFRDPTSRWH